MFANHSTILRRVSQVAVATAALTVLSVGVASACHPQGTIQKDVQNVTTGSATVKADTTGTALVAHPGDTLVYHITVGDTATGQDDQMINTIITDQLPAGLQLVKADSFNVGTVGAGKSVARTITVKVTATTNTSIKNQACYTADSADHKQPQKGCDVAYVNVVVPTPTPTTTPCPTPKPTPSPTPIPSPTPKPSPSPTPTPSVTPIPSPTPTPGQGEVLSATTLPDTGAPLTGTAIGLGAMVSAGVAYIKSRKR